MRQSDMFGELLGMLLFYLLKEINKFLTIF